PIRLDNERAEAYVTQRVMKTQCLAVSEKQTQYKPKQTQTNPIDMKYDMCRAVFAHFQEPRGRYYKLWRRYFP
ncbi:MAG: hypothetical protein ACYTEX_09090, partial [Planctomycetota bacterium]